MVFGAALLAAGCEDYAQYRRHGIGPVGSALFAAMSAHRDADETVPSAARGTCEDTVLLMGPHRPRGARARPAGHAPVDLRGFRVTPPAGPDWCVLIAGTRNAVFFVRNAHAGRAPVTPPDDRQRAHLLTAMGMLIRSDDGTPFTAESLQRMLAGCVGAARCALEDATSQVARVDGTECLVLTGRTASFYTIEQLHLACIHPRDPRYVVKLVVAEIFRKGAPFYRPPLMDTARPEYQPFLDSLRFAAIEP